MMCSRRTCVLFSVLQTIILFLILLSFEPQEQTGRRGHSSSTTLEASTSAISTRVASTAARTTIACGYNYGSFLTPTPAAIRSCPGGTLHALARGGRVERDGAFNLGNDCVVQWFTREEACDLVARAGMVLLVGDSLSRHLAQAFISVLAGNIAHGSVLPQRLSAASPQLLKECSCDAAYDDFRMEGSEPACRAASAAFLGDPDEPRAGPQTMACPNWDKPHFAFIFAAGHPEPGEGDAPWTLSEARLTSALKRVAAASDVGAAFVHLQVPALHVGLGEENRDDHERFFLKPIFSGIEELNWGGGEGGGGSSGRSGPRHITCATIHARQDNSKPEHIAKQGNPMILPHNAWLAKACEAQGARLGSTTNTHYAGLWDAWRFTANMTSHDGMHYDSRVNVVLAQLLLNVIAEAFDGER